MNMHSPDAAVGANRAAAYVRMSTGRQDQSIAYQLDYIARYAVAAECVVVKVYRDEGKSGLSAERRSGLQQLIADIAGGSPGFARVLVYDVSRWGRFQDVDESAYYEHLCSRNGIHVVYCAEHFANDGSPLAHIIKSVKRTMAAEYSRQLSCRTFEAQAFLLARGYKPGGAAGYGLRRLSVRADGSVRRVLENGERKCHPTDRVVLAPGPDAELLMVRRIFRLYSECKLSFRAVARVLNDGDAMACGERLWSDARVKAVLTNEKYCGNLLYNRTTARLGTKRRANDYGLWLRREGAHAPIITPEEFAAAQNQRSLRKGLDREAMLSRMRDIYTRHGVLTCRLIDAEPGIPHVALLKKMFGSLDRAYALALAPMDREAKCFRTARIAALRARLSDAARACIARAGRRAVAAPTAMVLSIDGRLSLRVAVASRREKAGCSGWVLPARAAGSDFVLCALLDEGGIKLLRYALLVSSAIPAGHKWLPASYAPVSGIICSERLGPLFGLDGEDDLELVWPF
jgi:DNA invertase Pin-like site-specific DNA recombinase